MILLDMLLHSEHYFHALSISFISYNYNLNLTQHFLTHMGENFKDKEFNLSNIKFMSQGKPRYHLIFNIQLQKINLSSVVSCEKLYYHVRSESSNNLNFLHDVNSFHSCLALSFTAFLFTIGVYHKNSVYIITLAQDRFKFNLIISMLK